MCELAQNTLTISNLPKNDTTLIVIGHGSLNNPQSAIDTRYVAKQISWGKGAAKRRATI